MTDSTIDAEQIKSEAIAAAQQALIDKLSPQKKYTWEERGKDAPENYDVLFDEFKKQTPGLTADEAKKLAREEFEALEADREAKRKEKEVESAKAKEQESEAKRKTFDTEWYQLVQEGKMPKVSDALQERINKGESLTKEEILADEGLKARLELAAMAKDKSAKLAFYEDYGKEQPGAHAPVLGNRPASPKETQELDYERDVKANRKKIFGW